MGLAGLKVEGTLAREQLAISGNEQASRGWHGKGRAQTQHLRGQEGVFGSAATWPSLAPFTCSSVLHSQRVKQSELFDRWKSLQMCRWAMNISEANQFKYVCPVCPPPALSLVLFSYLPPRPVGPSPGLTFPGAGPQRRRERKEEGISSRLHADHRAQHEAGSYDLR